MVGGCEESNVCLGGIDGAACCAGPGDDVVASERGFGSAGGTPPMAPHLYVQIILSSALDTNVILKNSDHFIVAACLSQLVCRRLEPQTYSRTPDVERQVTATFSLILVIDPAGDIRCFQAHLRFDMNKKSRFPL